MAEVNMELAKSVYETVCTALDNMGFKYERHDDDLVVSLGYGGKDMNHDMLIIVDAQREVVQVIEQLPVRMNAEKATEIACAVCYANRFIVCGKFTYDMEEEIRFKVAQIYDGSLIGPETIKRMVVALAITVEEYDDKFMALNNGYLKAEDFKD